MDRDDPLPALIAGDPAAWARFVHGHAALLHATAAKALGGAGAAAGVEAEDVVQSVFARLWEDGRRRLAGFQGRSRLSTWLVAVTQRVAWDRLRARTAPAAPGASWAPDPADGPHPAAGRDAPDASEAALARERTAALDAALATLPPRDRLLVRLVHLEGHGYAEVARLLAVPENSVSPWLARARARLATLLRRTDAAPDPL